MKKRSILFLAIIIWFAVTQIDFRNYSDNQYNTFVKRLHDVRNSNQDGVLVNKLTDFDWDYVTFAGGYEHLREFVKNTCNLDVSSLNSYNPNVESQGAWIFVKGNNAVVLRGDKIHKQIKGIISASNCLKSNEAYLYFVNGNAPYKSNLRMSVAQIVNQINQIYPPCDRIQFVPSENSHSKSKNCSILLIEEKLLTKGDKK